MPTPAFVPVIGSGFDADAAQQFQLLNFNRAQDEANIARQNQANRDYSQWLAQVATMDRADALRQDENLQQDIRFGSAQEAQARRDAEQKRQFDMGMQFSAQSEKDRARARKEEFDKQLELAKADESKQDQVLENFGKNYAPTVQQAAQEFEKSSKDYAAAENELLTYGDSKAKEIGDKTVVYNTRTRRIVMANSRMPPTDAIKAKMDAANEELAKREASFAGLQNAHQELTKHWQNVQQQAVKLGFTVNGSGPDVYLYHPKLDKTFGERVAEAKRQFKNDMPYEGGPFPTVDLKAPPPVETPGVIRPVDLQVAAAMPFPGIVPGFGPGANQSPKAPLPSIPPFQVGKPAEQYSEIRAEAMRAIAAGANWDAVNERYRKLTGKSL